MPVVTYIFILSVALLLVDSVTDVPVEGLGLGLALLFCLLDVLSLPNLADKRECRQARNGENVVKKLNWNVMEGHCWGRGRGSTSA